MVVPDRLLPLLNVPLVDEERSNFTERDDAAENIRQNAVDDENQPPPTRTTRPIRKRKPFITIRRVQMEAQYDPFRHGPGGAARFLAEQAREAVVDDVDHQPIHTMLISIRRKSQLAAFVILLIQFAGVDTYHLLPTGMILYAVALQVAWEQWTDEVLEQHQRYQKEQLQEEQWRHAGLQAAIRQAEFEYHILKNRRDIEIVPVEEPDGRVVLYAVPPTKSKRKRPPP
jgi:hypothetical protein